jgi:hypothetical protein
VKPIWPAASGTQPHRARCILSSLPTVVATMARAGELKATVAAWSPPRYAHASKSRISSLSSDEREMTFKGGKGKSKWQVRCPSLEVDFL